MDREKAAMQIKAAAYAAAASLGTNEAVKLLERVVAELRSGQWGDGPGNR